jgi:hypothetical protein
MRPCFEGAVGSCCFDTGWLASIQKQVQIYGLGLGGPSVSEVMVSNV